MTAPESKKPQRHLRASDVRGLAQLATQAASGVTRIVEGVHQSVRSSLSLEGGQEPGQTGGVTGVVYRSIQEVTRLLGESVDTGLATLEPLLEMAEGTWPGAPASRTPPSGTPQREAILAALNGVMGDRLVAGDNPLATPMTFLYRGELLDRESPPPVAEVTSKVLLLIHGLCMNHHQWHTERGEVVVDHGKALASALGYTPVYLCYNSGLHTSQNGRELAARLEELVAAWPIPIEDLTMVAHSLGGLVARSAAHYAAQDGLQWPTHLKNLVFLGTPHHGAPLERAGNWVDVILGSTPYTAPFSMLGQLRSAGITDLRYGHVLDEDWRGRDRFQRKPDRRGIVPLSEGTACFAVAATTAARRSTLANRLIGDRLVPLHSALGRHRDPARSLGFSEASQWIGYRMNHMQLLSSAEVSRQMVRWLSL